MRKTKSNERLGAKEANRAGTPLPSTLPIKRLGVFSRLAFILKVHVLNHRQQNYDVVNSLLDDHLLGLFALSVLLKP